MHFTHERETSMNRTRLYAVIEHDGQKLHWDVSEMSIINRQEADGVDKIESLEIFKHFNQFLAYMSKHAPVKIQKIWEAYVLIHKVYQESSNVTHLISKIQPLVQDIFDQLDIRDVDLWYAVQGHIHEIRIPANIDSNYVQTDMKPGSREQTYIRSDYESLLCLVIALRTMIPIWGEFLLLTKKETGNDYKEWVAFELLAKSKILAVAAFQKLKTYISSNLKSDRPMINSTFIGIGTEDYVDYLLGLLTVNRICVGDIRGIDSMPLYVSSYSYLKPKIGTDVSNNGGFGNKILAKKFSNGESDNDPSRIECYKIKVKHNQADLSAFDVYLRPANLHKAARKLYPGIDLNLLDLLMQNNRVLMSEPIEGCQSSLMQWVIHPIIVARAADHMQKESNVTGLTIAQTLLWQKGHRKLAMMITAISLKDNEVQHISSSGSMLRMSKDQLAQLDSFYPYRRVPAGRPKTKPFNPAIVAIESTSNDYKASDWLITAPDEMIKEAFNRPQRRQGCPEDIKPLLADLIISRCNKSLYQ